MLSSISSSLAILLATAFVLSYGKSDANKVQRSDPRDIAIDLDNPPELPPTHHKYGNGTTAEEIHAKRKVKIGEICSITTFNVPGDAPDQYVSCIKPDVDEQNWPWKEIGVWTKQTCKDGELFSQKDGFCRSARSVRRQQQAFCQQWPQYCGANVNVQASASGGSGCCCPPQCNQGQQVCVEIQCTIVIPRPCPLSQCLSPPCNAQPNGLCSWMTDPLAPINGDPFAFLQCHPGSPGLYCGRWVRMPCAPGTRFDAGIQVCVHHENPRPIISVSVTVCTTGTVAIGSCNAQQQCPGYSTCQQNTCCQPQLG